MLATGTVTDPLGANDVDAKSVSAGTTGALRTVRSSFFTNRINWGNSITETNQGPEATPDPYLHLAGPYTFGLPATVLTDARSRGIRIYKMEAGNGIITACLWDDAGALLVSKTQVWTADDGGWREVLWDTPVDLQEGVTYSFGYHYPTADVNYALSTYVWNNGQDTCVWPLLVSGVNAAWVKAGASPTWTNLVADRSYANSYVDPMVEWDIDIPGYKSGDDYFDQFPNGGSRFAFPIIIDFADPQWLDDYKLLGVNTLISGAYSADYRSAVVTSDMDWYPTLHGNDMSAPIAVSQDAGLATRVRGYMLTDEPEFVTETSPSVLRAWRNNCRRLDSTRPIYLNVGRMIQENQGFNWHPVGITAKDVNLEWREYMSLVDIGSLDQYGIARTYPYTYSGSDSGRYGIWVYPLQIHRMRTEVTDERIPIWGELETTSAYLNEPTPDQVKKTAWSMLIAGAKGIVYFDHRFSSPAVGQDFAAMIHDAPMSTAVQALNTQMINLAPALLADDAGLIESYTSSGELVTALGGYAAGAKIPLHYTSRVVSSTKYFFVQAIRPGTTTGVISIPGFAGATLTVIGESRSVSVDGSGNFTDSFSSDYAYHLYSTTATPSFTAPVNTVAPVITTDGTPSTGETVTVSTGTWTGAPTPTYTYHWQRAGVNISGATSSAYTLQGADEGVLVRCVVTGTNSQGSAAANSGTITPSAAGASDWATAAAASTPTAWWRLKDYTEEIAGRDFTVGAGTWTDVASLVVDPGDGSKHADASGTAYLTAADHSSLRLGSSFSVGLWVNPSVAATFMLVSKAGDFIVRMQGTKFRFTVLGASGFFADVDSTTNTATSTSFFVLGTWDFTTKTLGIMINGVLENTVDASGFGYVATSSGWGDLRIGQNTAAHAGDGYASGVIDEVLKWDRVLTEGEAGDLYSAGT